MSAPDRTLDMNAGNALGALFGILSGTVWLILIWFLATHKRLDWKTTASVVGAVSGIGGIWFGGHVADSRSTDLARASPDYIVGLFVTFFAIALLPLLAFIYRVTRRVLEW